MPLTRITLGDIYSDTQIAKVSTILHQSLVDSFAVPVEDCFQLIDKLPANQRIFNTHYLSGGRSEGFVLIQITAGRPRTREQKQSFYRMLNERLERELAISPDDVMIIIQFNQAEDWSFSRGEMFCP
ncbi:MULTISPECIES: tautomerase family protein [Kluyvera]|uniref:tautomerase family protein n=1 Tax=Kluyvera TaxID=579 RepID=UPI00200F35EF|nr:tautomerase family protein [Kluyvera ascorbata]